MPRYETKEEYRTEIKRLNQFVSMKALLRYLEISSSNYFVFMSGDDSKLSVEKLETVLNALESRPIASNIKEGTL